MKHSELRTARLIGSERVTLHCVSDNPTIKKVVGKEKDKLSGAHIKQMKNEMTKEGKHP